MTYKVNCYLRKKLYDMNSTTDPLHVCEGPITKG